MIKSSATTIKSYYTLAKPGIIMGNLMAAAGGFALASKGHINAWLFFTTLLGLGMVIASACIFNNWLDSDIDEKMERTKNRPLVIKSIPLQNAIAFATFLILSGCAILLLYTNLLATSISLAGFLIYVMAYSPSKRYSTYGTFIGSIAGGAPPIAGYCAVTNHFDAGASILFAIMILWQMPHFYAIALYRLNDYASASIPVLPLKKGSYTTKVRMLLYIIAFMIAAGMLTVFGYTGYIYLSVMTALGAYWFLIGIKGIKEEQDTRWARKMFLFSLVIVTALCILIGVDFVS